MVNNFEWHYRNYRLQYSFLKYTFNREFAMLPSKTKDTTALPIRNLRVHNIQHFQFVMDRLGAFKDNNLYNLYYSMAKYKEGIPYQDLTNLKRDNKEWNAEAYKHIASYDMLIDIDAGTHEELDFAKISMEELKQYFDRLQVPYHLRFSGMGFHFIIPHSYFPKQWHFNPYEDGNIYKPMTAIAKFLHDKFSEMIDYSIYDTRRIAKIPFSLSIYDDVVYCCKPIIEEFEIERMAKFTETYDDILHNSNGNIFKLLKDSNIKWQKE